MFITINGIEIDVEHPVHPDSPVPVDMQWELFYAQANYLESCFGGDCTEWQEGHAYGAEQVATVMCHIFLEHEGYDYDDAKSWVYLLRGLNNSAIMGAIKEAGITPETSDPELTR